MDHIFLASMSYNDNNKDYDTHLLNDNFSCHLFQLILTKKKVFPSWDCKKVLNSLDVLSHWNSPITFPHLWFAMSWQWYNFHWDSLGKNKANAYRVNSSTFNRDTNIKHLPMIDFGLSFHTIVWFYCLLSYCEYLLLFL